MSESPSCTQWRRLSRVVACLICTASYLFVGAAWASERDEAQAITNELMQVEHSVQTVRGELSKALDPRSGYDIARRLVDARVYFDMGHFDKASILFLDLVERPDFRANRQYVETVAMLGESLWKQRNYNAAEAYFEEVASSRSRYAAKAMASLVEIALSTQNTQRLNQLVGRIARMGRAADSSLRYAHAKALFHLERLDEASELFSRISANNPQFAQANYYLGVIQTTRQDYASAMDSFRVVASLNAADEKSLQVKEQALLALGRLSAEVGRSDQALEAYQRIDRNSVEFETALYEMAWVYISENEPAEALNVLEVLLLTVQDEHLAAEANILRGRLLNELERFEDAVDGYKRVVFQYNGINRELTRVGRTPERLDAFFTWLLHRRATDYDIARPLSERAAAFVESSESLSGVVQLFDDIGEERKDLNDSQAMLQQLYAALSDRGRLDTFPRLRNGWARLVEAELRLLRLQSRLLELESVFYRPILTGTLKEEYTLLTDERRGLDRELKRVTPSDAVEFEARKVHLDRRFAALERNSFLARQLLKRAQKQLEATEQWWYETEAGYTRESTVDGNAPDVMGAVERERSVLKGLHDELNGINQAMELQSARLGIRDLVSGQEKNIKGSLLKVQRAEDEFFRTVRESLQGEALATAVDLAALRERVAAGFDSLGRLQKNIEAQVQARFREFRQVVALQETKLKEYGKQVAAVEADSLVVARDLGHKLFRGARDQIRSVVLEADVGLIDVAWQRKREKTDRIRALGQERGSRLTELDRALEEVVADMKEPDAEGQGEEGASTPPAPPAEDKPEEQP